MTKKTVFLILIFVFALYLFAGYPQKSINLIVPWPVGGITDRVARALAPIFEKYIGVPVVVMNIPGASGAIGTEQLYAKPSDGYNILFSAETLGMFRVLGYSKLGFDDFDPISMVIEDEKVIVVPKTSKYMTIDDLVKDIKNKPGKVRMSYSGPGASGHIQGLLLKKSGLDVSMTPFGGGSPAMLAAISGQVEFTVGNVANVLEYIKSGDLKALAIFSKEKVAAMPEVPPITQIVPELLPYLPLTFPNCILIKKGTPAEVKATIQKALVSAFNDAKWIEFTDLSYYNRMDHLKNQDVTEYWQRWTSIVAWLLYDAGAAPNSPDQYGIKRFEK